MRGNLNAIIEGKKLMHKKINDYDIMKQLKFFEMINDKTYHELIKKYQQKSIEDKCKQFEYEQNRKRLIEDIENKAFQIKQKQDKKVDVLPKGNVRIKLDINKSNSLKYLHDNDIINLHSYNLGYLEEYDIEVTLYSKIMKNIYNVLSNMLIEVNQEVLEHYYLDTYQPSDMFYMVCREHYNNLLS